MMNKLNVIIPVYNGGAYFQECLESITPHLDIFEYIIISINKSTNQQNDIDICNSFIENNNRSRFKVFIRSKLYTGLKHGIIIGNDLKKDCDVKNSFIIYLCHDDILLPDFSKNILPILSRLQKNSAVNLGRARYRENFAKENFLFSYCGLLAYPDGISREDFFIASFEQHMPINMSGIITHIDVYFQGISRIQFLFYGFCAEYFFLASPMVTKIYGTETPLVGVRLHPAQESQIIPFYYIFIDTEICNTYLYYTTRDKINKKKILHHSRIIRFIKHPVTSILRSIYLKTIKPYISAKIHRKLKSRAKKWLQFDS